MSDKTYRKFVQRLDEVTELSPQSLGPFTMLYKTITRRFKVMPWPWYGAISACVAIALYVVFGPAVTLLVSILQKGF